jgi:hypothetical protein
MWAQVCKHGEVGVAVEAVTMGQLHCCAEVGIVVCCEKV